MYTQHNQNCSLFIIIIIFCRVFQDCLRASPSVGTSLSTVKFNIYLIMFQISTIFDSEKQYAPGEKIEMQVFAEHDSTVCLIGGRGGDSSFEHR